MRKRTAQSVNRIEDDCYIGCGVSSAHDVTISENTLVAAGSAIVESIFDNSDTWIGIPAEKLRMVIKRKFKIDSIRLKK